jgi:hypothetical protein
MSCQQPRDSREADACAVGVLNTWVGSVKRQFPQVSPLQACDLVAQGDGIESQVLSSYQRSASHDNLTHTEVWPYWRGQLQQRCSAAQVQAGASAPQPVAGPGAQPVAAPSLANFFSGAPGTEILPGVSNMILVLGLIVVLLVVRK